MHRACHVTQLVNRDWREVYSTRISYAIMDYITRGISNYIHKYAFLFIIIIDFSKYEYENIPKLINYNSKH